MSVSRHRFRRPLPPDLRKEMKKELRKLVGVRAAAVGEARRRRAKTIQEAKDFATSNIAEAQETFEKKRASVVATYEAKAAQRDVVLELATLPAAGS